MLLSIIFVNLILLCSLLLVLFIFYLSKHQNEEAKDFLLTKEEMKKFILWKSFYINPDDPRGRVPKVWGYGWTVNFRNKRNAMIFSFLVLSCLASAIIIVLPLIFDLFLPSPAK